jgi:predicted metal-dependent hydrolase
VAPTRIQIHTIRYGNQRIEFELITDHRRKDEIRIAVDPTVGVRVYAPASATTTDVRTAIRRRVRWIAKQLNTSAGKPTCNKFISGEQVLYLGKRYMLKVVVAQLVSVKLRGGIVCVELPDRNPANVAEALGDWYRGLAKRYFQRRLSELYSPALDRGHQAPPFRLQSMSRQWGSCSPSGKLVLNPALIRAPRECVDYVLTHELCHLQHHDHSPAFKKLLSRRMPDWKANKATLELVAHEVLR